MEDEFKIRKEIIEVSKYLHQRNFLAAADGNISYRLTNDRILITPTQKAKAKTKTDDIAVVNIEGQVLAGSPSSELPMHLHIFKTVPRAKAVVHAHPPLSIAWSIARPDLKELPAESMSELILAVGKIPIVPYARPGTHQMGEALSEHLPQVQTMILARHGALTWGESLEEACNGMERIEHSALILKYAHELGGITCLPEEEVAFLKQFRHDNLRDRIL